MQFFLLLNSFMALLKQTHHCVFRNQSVNESDASPIELQRLQRLRINRVAIVQELDVSHVLPYLTRCGTLTAADEAAINGAQSAHCRVRLLLDLLTHKGRDVDWYSHFRKALSHPDTFDKKVCSGYRVLVEFLDNAMIPAAGTEKAEAAMKLPFYKPLPSVADSGSLTMNSSYGELALRVENRQDMVKGVQLSASDNVTLMTDPSGEDAATHIHTPASDDGKRSPVLDHFTSLIEEPTAHFRRLSSGNERQLLLCERLVLKRMRRLEAVFVRDKRAGLPSDVRLHDIVAETLADPHVYHVYFKYFQRLRAGYDVDIIAEMGQSYESQLVTATIGDGAPSLDTTAQTGFRLGRFMYEMRYYGACKSVLTALQSALFRHSGDPASLPLLWQAQVELMAVHNASNAYIKAANLYNSALATRELISASEGAPKVNEAKLFIQLSILMREHGEMSTAITWAEEAIRVASCAEPVNEHDFVNALCNASLLHTLSWSANKAKLFASEAVRQARHHFGENDPLFIKSLLHYSYYSSQMKQDAFGVEVARAALLIAMKVYGGTNLEIVAEIQRALSCALLVGQQTTEWGREAVDMAEAAWGTVRHLIPAGHPTLMPYRITLAQCLQWGTMTESKDTVKESLEAAEQHTKIAYSKMTNVTRIARALNLLAQIHVKMGRLDEAEREMKQSYSMQPTGSLCCQLAMATLASHYRTVSQPQQAMDLLNRVVEEADCCGYVAWVHRSFETLISLLRATNQKVEADERHASMLDWLQRNPPQVTVSWSQLLEGTPAPAPEFWADAGGRTAPPPLIKHLAVRRGAVVMTL